MTLNTAITIIAMGQAVLAIWIIKYLISTHILEEDPIMLKRKMDEDGPFYKMGKY